MVYLAAKRVDFLGCSEPQRGDAAANLMLPVYRARFDRTVYASESKSVSKIIVLREARGTQKSNVSLFRKVLSHVMCPIHDPTPINHIVFDCRVDNS